MEAPSRAVPPFSPHGPLLAVLGVVLAGASAVAFLHAVSDGSPAPLRAFLFAGTEDPLAVTWFPALGGLVVAVGAVMRPPLLWFGLALLGTFGAYFFLTVGWAYLGATLLMAAWAARAPRAHPRET